MLKSLLCVIVCPKCNCNFALESSLEDNNRVIKGNLICNNPSCKSVYRINDGFPDLTVYKFEQERKVARTFGFEWRNHHEGRIEAEKVFGRTIEQDLDMFFEISNLNRSYLKGKTILDVGCGSAKLTKALTQFSPEYVLGVDINESTYLSHKYCYNSDKCQILRSDVFNLPIKNESIDIGWSCGVIHHTPDAKAAFKIIGSKIKPGGRLSIWVYKKGFYPFRFIKDIFKYFSLDRLPNNIIFYLSKVFSILSIVIHGVYRILFWIPINIYGKKNSRIARTLRYRPYDEFLMTWFDALSPCIDSRHTIEEVEGWFKECGFIDLKFWDNQIGMSGTKSNNFKNSASNQ